ncbi:MAG: (d)CMP kinase [Bacteroidetes bacterium]|nr:(d)CMP kinase [Bacteroidota bacterium]MDA0879610.1 (d)CMP kinase [Bacteroidota bacterium]MDA1115685.1 (d)CMP kinase [Bacteroidota bacterium]
MKKITIAIDGYSSTGKSTLAKALAKKMGYLYVDSGAMYRAVTLYALDNGLIASELNQNQLISLLPQIQIEFKMNPETGIGEVFLNGKNVEQEIRSMRVSEWVSPVSAISEVRTKLVSQQQSMGLKKGVVMDGRDIGSVVFPNAELKLFLTADDDVRAKRRFDELMQKPHNVSLESVKANLIARDQQDSSREDSPLIQTQESVVIDNSKLTIQDQLDLVLNLIAGIN